MKKILLILLFCFPFVMKAQEFPHVRAHAHNDYEHNRPLLEALDNGFISVEADIYLVDGELYVTHNKPEAKDPSRTLRALYLDPLMKRVKAHNGKVYDGYDDFFYLMIDIKSDGVATCKVLDRQLQAYRPMLSVIHDSTDEKTKPVKIFLSGNRTGHPAWMFKNENYHLFALDGRPGDLGKNIPSALMPVVSQDYWKMMSWNGKGKIDPAEEEKLEEFIARAHAEGKKTRLWGEPDNPKLWAFFLGKGMDLINTDKLAELADFFDKNQNH
jgi:hypothetical protein